MPDFRRMPLGQLTLYCPPLRPPLSGDGRGAWSELQRRALGEQNPVAWDALLMRLWPIVLFWIYERAPEMSPAMAERLAQQILSAFKHRHLRTPPAVPLPSHERLLADLHQLVTQMLSP